MCCDLPKARPPAQRGKMSREEVLENLRKLDIVVETNERTSQTATHRGIPSFLNMHYNHTGHTPGSREEKYLSANEVRLGIRAESYQDWHKRHTQRVKASQKRVATYRNDDGTTTSFEYMKVEVPKVLTGTIQPNIISAGWNKSGPVYGHDDDPEGTEYQNYSRAAVPDYAHIMSKKDYEMYTGTPRGPVPVPKGPEPRYEGDLRTLGGDARMLDCTHEHDAELASLNVASSLMSLASISILILNMMGG